MTNTVSRITSYDFLGIFIPVSVGMTMVIAKCFPDTLYGKAIVQCCGCKESVENTALISAIEMFLFFAGGIPSWSYSKF